MKLRNFKAHEFVDRATYELHGEKCLQMFDRALLLFIDGFHTRLQEDLGGKISIVINDWKWGGKFQWRGIRNIHYYTDQLAKKLKRKPTNEEALEFFEQSRSQHKYGRALDFDVYQDSVRISPDVIRKIIIDYRTEHLITFIEDKVNWCHIDMRYTEDDLLVLYNIYTKGAATYARGV